MEPTTVAVYPVVLYAKAGLSVPSLSFRLERAALLGTFYYTVMRHRVSVFKPFLGGYNDWNNIRPVRKRYGR